jgi:penicillin-binding protein 1C
MKIWKSGPKKKLLLALSASAGLGLLWHALWPSPRPPTFEQVRESRSSSDASLVDRLGELLQVVRVDDERRRLDWVPLGEVSPAAVRALVAAEDRRFFFHHGVDWKAAAAAALGRLRGGSRGASTITMQLASFLDPASRPRGSRRSWAAKLRQVRFAWALERSWSKGQILEAYLNLLDYRGELQGIAAASRGLFDKDPHGLDAAEALVLASLPREPSAGIEPVVSRADRLARRLGWDVPRSELEETAKRSLLAPYRIRSGATLAPHAARRLIARSPLETWRRSGRAGARIVRSTLDASIQRIASEALESQLASLSGQNVQDGAALVVDNRSGDVLAYVGRAGSDAKARFVDGVTARRQTGSTLKPFLYALALDRRLLTAASTLDDSPLEMPAGPGSVYRPENYDRAFRGPVSVRVALASSINVPAVRTLGLVGVSSFVDTLTRLGVSELRSAEDYGPSLALGTADLTLWELVDAYHALANGGRRAPLRLSPGERRETASRVFSPQAAFIVGSILSDRSSRSSTFGLESPLATRYWTAVKTGTSKDMRDNWCLGWSARYTVGVWVGNFSGAPMWSVSGMSGAAPAWAQIMDRLHERVPSLAPAPPRGLLARRVRPAGEGSERLEWFIEGTEPAGPIETAAGEPPHVVSPAPGSVIALDPDIPDEDQRVVFEADPVGEGLTWRLNGRPLGSAAQPVDWRPTPGRWNIELVDAEDRRVDASAFEVR